MLGKRIIDCVNLFLGLWLTVSPWATGTESQRGSSTIVFILGAAVLIAAIWAMGKTESSAPEWWVVALGVILFVAPWIFGYFRVSAIAWDSWIVGIVLALLGLITVPMVKQINQAHTA